MELRSMNVTFGIEPSKTPNGVILCLPRPSAWVRGPTTNQNPKGVVLFREQIRPQEIGVNRTE